MRIGTATELQQSCNRAVLLRDEGACEPLLHTNPLPLQILGLTRQHDAFSGGGALSATAAVVKVHLSIPET